MRPGPRHTQRAPAHVRLPIRECLRLLVNSPDRERRPGTVTTNPCRVCPFLVVIVNDCNGRGARRSITGSKTASAPTCCPPASPKPALPPPGPAPATSSKSPHEGHHRPRRTCRDDLLVVRELGHPRRTRRCYAEASPKSTPTYPAHAPPRRSCAGGRLAAA